MKLYRIDYANTSGKNCTTFARTQSEAKRKQALIEGEMGRHNVEDFVPIDVPTTHEGLCDFLVKLMLELD